MKAEAEDRRTEMDLAFEQSLFVHDRDLWQKVYEPSPDEIERDVEWVTPDQNPEEFREMMADLRDMGFLAD